MNINKDFLKTMMKLSKMYSGNLSNWEIIELVSKVDSIEKKYSRYCINYYNGSYETDQWESYKEKIEEQLNKLVSEDNFYFEMQGDPRGQTVRLFYKDIISDDIMQVL